MEISVNANPAFRNRLLKRQQDEQTAREREKHNNENDDSFSDDESEDSINESSFDELESTASNQEDDEKSEDSELSKLQRDYQSMLGRLKQTQEEKERYRIGAENGSFAAVKLLEVQEKLKAKEKELEQLKSAKAENPPPDSQELTDEEESQLRDEIGDLAASKFIQLLKKENKDSDLNKEIEKLRQEIHDSELMKHREKWFNEMKKQIPDFQGLISSDATGFQEFLKNKTDWAGNNAFDLVGQIGANMDISKIGLIRHLIDEYNNQKNRNVKNKVATAPPTVTGQAVSQGKEKRVMTDSDKRELARLKKTPNSAESIRKFYAKFQ